MKYPLYSLVLNLKQLIPSYMSRGAIKQTLNLNCIKIVIASSLIFKTVKSNYRYGTLELYNISKCGNTTVEQTSYQPRMSDGHICCYDLCEEHHHMQCITH